MSRNPPAVRLFRPLALSRDAFMRRHVGYMPRIAIAWPRKARKGAKPARKPAHPGRVALARLERRAALPKPPPLAPVGRAIDKGATELRVFRTLKGARWVEDERECYVYAYTTADGTRGELAVRVDAEPEAVVALFKRMGVTAVRS